MILVRLGQKWLLVERLFQSDVLLDFSPSPLKQVQLDDYLVSHLASPDVF